MYSNKFREISCQIFYYLKSGDTVLPITAKLYCRQKEQHVNWVSNNGKTYHDASYIYFPQLCFWLTHEVLTAVNTRITFLRVTW
jgi:hypothetical protein